MRKRQEKNGKIKQGEDDVETIRKHHEKIMRQAWGRQCETPTFTLNLYVDFETFP